MISMTREEAIRILDPETTGEALAEIEYYGGFSGKTAAVQAVSDACILAVSALREQEQRRWIPVTERLPEIPDGWAENPEPVLYMMKNTKTMYAGYYGEGGVWRDKYFRQYADSREVVDAHDVLCWMWQHDLPQPPKGE